MRKVILGLLSVLFLPAAFLHAQGKTDVYILGRDKGTVSSMQTSGVTLLDARAVTKKLGGSVELYAAAKQIKVAFPGMYAVLSAPLDEAVVNAQTVKLPAEVVASGSKIFVPVQFFMLPQVEKALDRQITFENNALIVEKNFTVAFADKEQKEKYDRLHFFQKGEIAFTSQQKNKHTVEVVFPNAVLKRSASQRLKDDFIRSFTLTQHGKDVRLKVILGKKAKTWRFAEENGELVFAAAEKDLPLVSSSSVNAEPETEAAEELDLSPSVQEEDLQTLPVMKAEPLPVMISAEPEIKEKRKLRIMIDPGHGGKDPGATRRGSAQEKALNLTVSKHLYNYLKKQGFDVKMTRDKDEFVTLAGRSKMANDFKADLFVSVHTNAARRAAANGFEVYFRSDKATDKEAAEVAAFENEALQYEEAHYSFVDMLLESMAKNEFMNESSKLAGHIRNYVYKEPGIGIAVRQNNAIRQANFYVLRGVKAPAVLVEMGYISSAKDRARLNNKAAQKRMGDGIGKGIVSYLKAERKIP